MEYSDKYGNILDKTKKPVFDKRPIFSLFHLNSHGKTPEIDTILNFKKEKIVIITLENSEKKRMLIYYKQLAFENDQKNDSSSCSIFECVLCGS
jgi:hypothetical protein